MCSDICREGHEQSDCKDPQRHAGRAMRLALSRCARLALSRCAPLRLASYPAPLLRLRCVPPVPAPCGAVACLAKHAKGGKGKGKGKGKAAKQDEEEQPVEGAVLAVPPLASL